MDLYEMDFGKIIVLRDDIGEVIIDEGVEMDETMVDTYHDCLLKYLRAPFSLLINKVNAYSYSFAAQANLATIPEINTMAVVAYNRLSATAMESLINVPRKKQWNIQLFSERERAYEWLLIQQEAIAQKHEIRELE